MIPDKIKIILIKIISNFNPEKIKTLGILGNLEKIYLLLNFVINQNE